MKVGKYYAVGPSNYYGTLMVGREKGGYRLALLDHSGFDFREISRELATLMVAELAEPRQRPERLEKPLSGEVTITSFKLS